MLRKLFDKAEMQAIIAFMVTAAILAMPYVGIEIPAVIENGWMAIVGFYYGLKAAQA